MGRQNKNGIPTTAPRRNVRRCNPYCYSGEKTDPRAYTRIYNTFNDEFYHLSSETEEYDRILVYKTSYFMVGWGIENYELVEIETPSVRKRNRGENLCFKKEFMLLIEEVWKIIKNIK